MNILDIDALTVSVQEAGAVMNKQSLKPKKPDLLQALQLVPFAALLAAPLLSFASPVVPTTSGLDVSWKEVSTISGINVHRGDGSYVESLPSTATSWTAAEAGEYFFVSVVGDDWQQWDRSSVVSLVQDSHVGTMGELELLASESELFWQALSSDWRDANGNALIGLNVHSAIDGQYLNSIAATEQSWTPPSQGDYFLVLVTESDWRDWPRTNTVSFSGETRAAEQPMLRAENGQLVWDSLAGNPSVRSINIHRQGGEYLATVGADVTAYLPEESGVYYIVAVIGDSWQNWPKSNTVTTGDEFTGAIVDTTSYQEILGATMGWFRADYYEPFMQALFDALRLWGPVLPSVSNTFDTMATWDEFTSEDDDKTCDSGSVARIVTDITTPGLGNVPSLSATYVFDECVFGDRTINGTVAVTMRGDSPARLGGQVRRENIDWQNFIIASPSGSVALTGSYAHSDGYAGPTRSFSREYSTVQYLLTEQFFDEPDYTVSVDNSQYSVVFRSSYLSEDATISLIESGQLNIGDDEISAVFSMSEFSYAGEVFVEEDSSVSLSIGENVASGNASFVFSDSSSVIISKDNASENTVEYAISDGVQTINIVDAWSQPIRCEEVALGVFSDYSACP